MLIDYVYPSVHLNERPSFPLLSQSPQQWKCSITACILLQHQHGPYNHLLVAYISVSGMVNRTLVTNSTTVCILPPNSSPVAIFLHCLNKKKLLLSSFCLAFVWNALAEIFSCWFDFLLSSWVLATDNQPTYNLKHTFVWNACLSFYLFYQNKCQWDEDYVVWNACRGQVEMAVLILLIKVKFIWNAYRDQVKMAVPRLP